jgi:hypothetical protein
MVAALLSHQMAYEIAEGRIKRLPIMFSDTMSKIGLFYRDESHPSPAAQVLMNAIRSVAENKDSRLSKVPCRRNSSCLAETSARSPYIAHGAVGYRLLQYPGKVFPASDPPTPLAGKCR